MKVYKKKYAIHGMVEQSCVFPVGGGHIRVDFRNGSLTTAGIVPATYTTKNQVVQKAIESSHKFKKGVIKLMDATLVCDTEDEDDSFNRADNVTAADKEQVTTGDGNEGVGDKTFPDVKNSQQAKDILLGEPFNAPLVELGNKTAILIKAEELGILFPNWK